MKCLQLRVRLPEGKHQVGSLISSIFNYYFLNPLSYVLLPSSFILHVFISYLFLHIFIIYFPIFFDFLF